MALILEGFIHKMNSEDLVGFVILKGHRFMLHSKVTFKI